jgi:hypothetical protein
MHRGRCRPRPVPALTHGSVPIVDHGPGLRDSDGIARIDPDDAIALEPTNLRSDECNALGEKLGGARSTEPTARCRQASATTRRANAANRAADILPAIRMLQESGCASLHTIAAGLTAQGIPTPRGSDTWRPAQVARVLARGLS